MARPWRVAQRCWTVAVLIAAALLTVVTVPATEAAAAGDLTVWVSPAGSDANDGLSAATPFKTLQHASDVLCAGGPTCPGRGQPVIVRLAQTTWKDQPTAASVKAFELNAGDEPAIMATTPTTWHYFDPAFPTTFEPWNYQPGDDWDEVAASGGYPTFDGGHATDTGFVFTPLTAMKTGSTGLTFLYTRWQRYRRTPIFLNGGLATTTTSAGTTVYTPTGFTANGVTFYGNYFYQVGNYFRTSNQLAYGAILANNSSGDVYRNNHFVQLMNRATDQDSIHVHALYIGHWSNNSLAEGNNFTDITGDPVRQRDHSYGTLVRRNTFTQAGASSYMDDYYCRPNMPNSYCAPKEYRSYGGVFTSNTLNGLYNQGIGGRRTVYCYDQRAGLCPTDRIKVTS